MERFFLDWKGEVYKVTDLPDPASWTPVPGAG
jgi:hypothetical protein